MKNVPMGLIESNFTIKNVEDVFETHRGTLEWPLPSLSVGGPGLPRLLFFYSNFVGTKTNCQWLVFCDKDKLWRVETLKETSMGERYDRECPGPECVVGPRRYLERD